MAEKHAPQSRKRKKPSGPVPAYCRKTKLKGEMRAWAAENRNKNTAKNYESALKQATEQFKEWNEELYPARPEAVAAYIRSLVGRGYAASTIDTHVAAIADLHRYDRSNPCKDQLVIDAKKIARRTAPGKRPGKVLTLQMLSKIAHVAPDAKAGKRKGLQRLRDYTMLLLGFVATLRASEIVELEPEDITCDKTAEGERFLAITIRKSKTDQEGEGAVVLAAERKSGSYPELCPVLIWEQWMEQRSKDQKYLFYNLQTANEGGKGKNEGRLAPNTVTHTLKRWLTKAGYDPDGWASHACRRGGATAAAEGGIAARLLQRHGRWKSDAYKVYIVESLENQLRVSEAIQSTAK